MIVASDCEIGVAYLISCFFVNYREVIFVVKIKISLLREKYVTFGFLKFRMRRYFIFLPFMAFLLINACKETEVVSEIIEEEAKTVLLRDSISFDLNGKHYGFTSEYQNGSIGYGNQGVNLRLSDTIATWYHAAGNQYWIGDRDSVQYFSYNKYASKNSDIHMNFYFVKNNKKSKMLHVGPMYYPLKNELFYQVGDLNYAVDFGRKGQQEGIALSLLVNQIDGGLTYSDKGMNQVSVLTTESQLGSKFKIEKVEEIKETDFVWIEGTFESNLYNVHEEKTFRVTDGYFRLKVYKYGNRLIFN